MSKKNLLKESTIRQFMKFANIGSLADNFVNETYGHDEEPLEEGSYMEDEEGMAPTDDDMGTMDVGEEEPMADLEDEEETEVTDTSEASIEALVDALADTITQVTGVEVTAAGDTDMDPMGDEPPMDDMGDMTDAPETPMDDEEGLLDENEAIDEESVVEETLKRVMSRLSEMKSKHADDKKQKELIETIAAAVEKRLASK